MRHSMSNNPEPEFEASESFGRSGASATKQTQPEPAIHGTGASQEIQTLVYGGLEKYVADLNLFSAKVADFVRGALEDRVAMRWQQSDDALFLPHTLLVKTVLDKPDVIRSGLGLLPTQVWTRGIWPWTQQAEEQLRQNDPHARIHKGTPLINVAFCFLSQAILTVRFNTSLPLE